jgi:hypothetical protein
MNDSKQIADELRRTARELEKYKKLNRIANEFAKTTIDKYDKARKALELASIYIAEGPSGLWCPTVAIGTCYDGLSASDSWQLYFLQEAEKEE